MNIYDFEVMNIDQKKVSFSEFKNKVLVIVNTASQCGFTSQYKGLEELYDKYKDQGVLVLGFPCNQFGGQEPGDEEEIKKFCQLNYEVKFPLFKKIDVNGENADPLYKYLTTQAPGILGTTKVKWNFTKFIVDRQGNVVTRLAPQDSADKVEKEILPLI